MAHCVGVDLGNGRKALVRMSGRRPAMCEFCRVREHTKLCDAIVDRKTCDAKLCDKCAIVSSKQDFCPKHKELA